MSLTLSSEGPISTPAYLLPRQKWIITVPGLEHASVLGITSTVSQGTFLDPQDTEAVNAAVYNFLQWSFLYTIFVMMTLIIANTLRTTQRPYPGVDAQQMVIIGFAGLFAIFTGSLFIAHTRLIVLNMTTIEDMALSRVKARERSALTRVHGFWNLR